MWLWAWQTVSEFRWCAGRTFCTDDTASQPVFTTNGSKVNNWNLIINTTHCSGLSNCLCQSKQYLLSYPACCPRLSLLLKLLDGPLLVMLELDHCRISQGIYNQFIPKTLSNLRSNVLYSVSFIINSHFIMCKFKRFHFFFLLVYVPYLFPII